VTSTTVVEPAPPPDEDEELEARPDETDDEDALRRRRFRRRLTLIAVAGLAVRLVYLLGWKNTGQTWSDSFYYHEGANLLADGHGYVHPFQWISHGLDIPGADHPPGYLTLLSAVSLLGFRSFLAHQLFSCIVGMLGVVAFGWAGRRIAGERVGLLTALILALSPNVWFHDALVMSESLVVATTALVLWAAYRWWDRAQLLDAAIFGVVVGLAALVRSEALLLGPAIALPLLYFQRRRSPRADLRQVALAGGLAALVIAPWVIFNVARFEHPVTLSAQFEHTLVSANCDDVYFGDSTGYWSRPCVEAVEAMTDPLDDASEEGVTFRRVARDYVENHKGRAILVGAARVGRTFGLYQPQNQVNLDTLYDGKEKGLGEAGLLTWYVVAVAGAFGLVGLRRAGRPIFPLLAVIGATAATVLVTYGSTRFRFPAELALCIPAAVSLDAAIGAFAKSRRPEPEAELEPEPEPEAEEKTEPDEPEPPVSVTEEIPGRASASIRFAGLDGLRAIAALGVLVCHVGLASGQIDRLGGSFLARADVGVALFFMLSGFLLYRPFVSARLDDRPRPEVPRYLRHRFLRIFPAYWLALTVLTVVLDVRNRVDVRTPWDFTMYYGLAQSYSKETALGGLQQAWTLTNEVAFYLLLPLWALGAAWLFRRLRGRAGLAAEALVLTGVAVASLAFRVWVAGLPENSLSNHTFGQEFFTDPRLHWILSNFNMFVPGMALALAFEWSRRRDRPLAALELMRRHPMVCWALAAAAFVTVSSIGLPAIGIESAGDVLGLQLLYAAVGFLLLAPVALNGETLPRSLRWLGTRVMVTLGLLSYGIYLWHEGVTDIYRDMRDMPQLPNGDYQLAGWFPAMLLASVVGSIAVAAVSYVLVERPALLLKDRDRKLFGDWQPVGLPPSEIETVEVAQRPFLSRFPRWVLPAAVVGVVVALPLRGFFLTPGAPFEEGFMLAFPERLLEGDIPNKDFLHLYGPGSLWSLAAFYQVLGVDIWVERFFGLLQLLGVISAITVVGYRWGRWPALLGGSVCAILIMPPVGLTALAWAGGMAFSVWAVIRLSRVFDERDGHPPDERTRRRILLTAGLLAAGALLFRPDQVLALGLPFGAAFLWGLTGKDRRSLVTGLGAGLSLYLVHFALAGPGNAINGMFVEVVLKLRPGRSLPFPPDPDEMTSFLNQALLYRNWPWPFPALDEPMQVFVWVPLLFAVTGFVLYVGVKSRRAGAPNGWLLFLLGLFALGTMPQVIQRVDTAHLAWVSAVPFGLLPAAIAEWYRLRGGERPAYQRLLPLAPLVLMFVIVPHYSVRWYADYTGQSVGYMTEGQREITNRGRSFYYGRADAAGAAQELIRDVEELTEPGDKLIVGTGDLRQTPYTETFFYYLLPQLEPGTHYMEMEPGITTEAGSGLADELREADVYIASTLYDNWDEPNASMDVGSDEPNQVLREEYCLQQTYGEYWTGDERYGDGMYRLYLRC
jgi:peptidoglycan/LPS O-acetylase OafA/YrhL/4-amino-4-deoxy-L-arabinose transferase-like glycosyltransferase